MVQHQPEAAPGVEVVLGLGLFWRLGQDIWDVEVSDLRQKSFNNDPRLRIKGQRPGRKKWEDDDLEITPGFEWKMEGVGIHLSVRDK